MTCHGEGVPLILSLLPQSARSRIHVKTTHRSVTFIVRSTTSTDPGVYSLDKRLLVEAEGVAGRLYSLLLSCGWRPRA